MSAWQRPRVKVDSGRYLVLAQLRASPPETPIGKKRLDGISGEKLSALLSWLA